MSAVPAGEAPAPGLLRSVKRRLLGDQPAQDQAGQDIAFLRDCPLFDRAGYLQRYPDVAEAGIDPVEHYVVHGTAEGRDPCDLFSTAYYLESNQDVAASRINPLRHFCEHGWREGRAPSPGYDIAAYAAAHENASGLQPLSIIAAKPGSAGAESSGGDDAQVIAESGIFDAEFYLASYPKVAKAGADPVRHYVNHGAREGLDPSPFFDTRYYLASNPDVAQAGRNPLVHFCKYGWKEFRQPSSEFDIVRYWLMHMVREGQAGNPLVHYLQHGRPDGIPAYRLDEQGPLERNRMTAVAESLFDTADVATLKLLGRALSRIARWPAAEEAFRRVAAREWAVADNHAALAKALAAQKKWWLVVEAMSDAVELDKTRGDWFFTLADACERMNRFDAAVDAFRKAIALAPHRADWHYRLGHVLERAGAKREAAVRYAEAVRLSNDKDVVAHGIGVFHQARGMWEEARDAYLAEIERKPLSGGLRYRLGMAFDRLYDWQQAADAYIAAIALSATARVPSWHFRLGFVRERMEQWDEAGKAYAAAIALSPERHVPYWNYRLGYVLEKAGRLQDACNAWRNAYRNPKKGSELEPYDGFIVPEAGEENVGNPDPELGIEPPQDYFRQFGGSELVLDALRRDLTIADTHYSLGERRERMGDMEGAAAAYAAAVARSSDHKPSWYYRLGHVLAKAGHHQQACDAFRQTRIIQRPHGVSEDAFRKHEDQLITTSYLEYSQCLPVRDDVIVYESFNGNSLTCNPLALFRALVDHPQYRNHLHVWVLNDPDRIPGHLRHRENVVFVSKGSDGYLRYLATAKYLINNSGFPPYFVRRPEQRYLATWHGTPLKTLGKEQKYKFYDHKRTQRNFLQASHLITPNPHTTQITLDSYDIRPLFTGLLAETGYPRIDLTLNATDARKRWLRQRLGVSGEQPIVLYAPTWRGTLDEVEFDVGRLESDLEALSQQGCQVLFRGHSLLERVIESDHLGTRVVPADIDTNELLSVVDVLVTDYSSVFFDFMATGRPILYYIYDVEQYEEERGLYFGMDEMPGYKCRTIEELCDALGQAIQAGMLDQKHYDEARRQYTCHEDGHATERVIEFFFNDNPALALDYRKSDKPAVIMAGGSFLPNGITTSFINLVNHIDRDSIDVVVALSPNAMELTPSSIGQFRKLPKDIIAVPRYGNLPLTLEERWLRKRHEAGKLLGDEAEAIMQRVYRREFVRIFGFKQFDAVVSFAGYDTFWTAVLLDNDLPFRKVVYLHNDMYAEHITKYPELERMFRLYDKADLLVSVSEKTNVLNRSNLAGRYGLTEENFVSCDNVSNAEEIIARADDALERPEDVGIFAGGPVFINVARLSVEKDQEKLLRAFSKLLRKVPDARLLILGTGPLQHHLHQVVSELGLQKSVHLLGYRANPYPYLRRSDCFVLSSNHEGQPMTLLEALVLEKPVVATDIVGNRSVMEGRGGLLVENSVEGLCGGMEEFVSGKVPVDKFNWRAYNESAVGQFYRYSLGLSGSDVDSIKPSGGKACEMEINFFNKATSEHYLGVQGQLNRLVMDEVTRQGGRATETGREYVEGALNFTWFIRQKADVLMSHGVADKNYYWMPNPKTSERYLDRFQAVLVPGQWMKDRIVRSAKLRLGEDDVYVVGWPRLDLLRRRQADVEVPSSKKSLRILWAPTHDARKRGPEQKSTSTYPDFEPFFEKLAKKYESRQSLHPSNRGDKTPTMDGMLWANVVISDFGTMVYEAWALGKPVIFPGWILQDRIQKYLPGSAEAYIFENKIGYHPATFMEMEEVLAKGPVITPDVDEFMSKYLDNYANGLSAPKVATALRVIAEKLKV